MYDLTNGNVITPNGPAKFISYKNGKVTVEHDYMYLVEYDGSEVFLDGRQKD